MAISLIAIILDAIGISVFVPALASIISNEGVFQLPANLLFWDKEGLNFPFNTNNNLFVIYLIIIVFSLKASVQFLYGANIAILRSNLSSKLRIDYVTQYSITSHLHTKQLNSGYLVGLLGEQIFKISNSVVFYLQFCATGLAVFLYIVVGAFISPNVGIYLSLSGLCMLLIYLHLNQKITKTSQLFTLNSNKFASRVLQLTRNIKYLISTNSTKTYQDLASNSANMAAKNDKKIGLLAAFSTSIKEPLIIIVITIIIYIEAIKFGNSGSEVLLSVVFFYRGFNAAMSSQNFYQRFLECTGSIDEYLDSANALRANAETQNGKQVEQLSNKIEFNNVSVFAGGNKILDEINLTIECKKTFGIIGESGSGKSTLLNVLTLIQPLDCGSLLIDGTNSKSIDFHTWRNQLGLVPQEPVIFDGTIKDNILMSYDQKIVDPIDYERLLYVCKLTELTQVINKTKLGLDYIVGEGGVNLSGGQRQRLNIARELYREKEILILDEPTSALDSESEKIIIKIINELKGLKTIIVVSHSEQFISCLDTNIKLKAGKIIPESDLSI